MNARDHESAPTSCSSPPVLWALEEGCESIAVGGGADASLAVQGVHAASDTHSSIGHSTAQQLKHRVHRFKAGSGHDSKSRSQS